MTTEPSVGDEDLDAAVGDAVAEMTEDEQVGDHRAVGMASLELARVLIEDSNQSGAHGGIRQRVHRLLSGTRNPYDEARLCLDRVVAQKQKLASHGSCAEALVLQAKLAELEGDFSSARAALAEAQELTAALGWIPLDQLVNSEIRRVGKAVG